MATFGVLNAGPHCSFITQIATGYASSKKIYLDHHFWSYLNKSVQRDHFRLQTDDSVEFADFDPNLGNQTFL